MMNNNKPQSMHNNWYQNSASLPRAAVNAPIQFQQFDVDEEMQQCQPQFFNPSNSNSFGVITVPDGRIPFQFTQAGVQEFAFANIPTNIAFNFGDNFAMQNQFGPPTIPIHPPQPNHFVGFNDQFPSTNTADINHNNLPNHDMINQIGEDIEDIPDIQDTQKCARINNEDTDNIKNNDDEEQDEINTNMMNNFNDLIQNVSNNDHHFVQQDESNDNQTSDNRQPIEEDQDILPPAINEQPMRAQYSRCSEASNTTNTTHLSHDSHAVLNVHNNYNQRPTRRRMQRQRQRQRIFGDFKYHQHRIGRLRRAMYGVIDPNNSLLSQQRPRYRVAVDYPNDVDDKHIIHRSINPQQQYYQHQRYQGQLPQHIVHGPIPQYYDDEMESQNSNTSFSNTTASPAMSGNGSVKTSPSFDSDHRINGIKAESPESMILNQTHHHYNHYNRNNPNYGLNHEPKLISRTATIIEHDDVDDDIPTSSSFTKQTQIQSQPLNQQQPQQRRSKATSSAKKKKPSNNNAKPFECPECGNRYKYKSSMKLHFKVHTSEAKICKECGKRFPHEHKLKIHMRSHTGERPYKCDICPKAFSDKSNLNRHKRLHTGEKPYECEYCHRRYSDSSALVDHRRRKHTLEKPYKCTFCSKTFAASSDLTSHLAVHSDIRPFECTQCKKRFKRRSDVHKHMKTHQVKIDKRRRRSNDVDINDNNGFNNDEDL